MKNTLRNIIREMDDHFSDNESSKLEVVETNIVGDNKFQVLFKRCWLYPAISFEEKMEFLQYLKGYFRGYTRFAEIKSEYGSFIEVSHGDAVFQEFKILSDTKESIKIEFVFSFSKRGCNIQPKREKKTGKKSFKINK